MMSLTFGLFTQVSGSGPLGPLVFFLDKFFYQKRDTGILFCRMFRVRQK